MSCSSASFRAPLAPRAGAVSRAGFVLGLVLILGVSLARPASAQWTFEPRLIVEAQHYTFGDVHQWQDRIQDEVRSSLGLPVEAITSFPVRSAVRVDAVVARWKAFQFGAGVGYGSSAGRLAYSDYSGDFFTDQIAERWHAGLLVESRLLRHLGGPVPLSTWASLHAHYVRSTVDLEQRIRLSSGDDDVQTQSFASSGVAAEPAFEVQADAGPLLVRIRAGVEIGWSQALTLGGETLYVDEDDKLSVNWSGARLGLTLAYPFR